MGSNIVSLSDRRPPITYTVRLRHHYDGSMAIWVQDVADTPEDRRKVADALRAAADQIEQSVKDDE